MTLFFSRLLFVFCVALLFEAPLLSAQGALHPEDAGWAIARRPVSSGAEAARCLREKDTGCLRATPEEVLRSFQMRFPQMGLRTVEDLANRMDSWIIKPCPRVTTSLARLVIPQRGPRTIDFKFRRMLRVGEECFVDTQLMLFVASASCMNALGGEDLPYVPPTTQPLLPAPEPPRPIEPVPQSLRFIVMDSAGVQSSQALRWTRRDTTLAIGNSQIFVSIWPSLPRDTTPRLPVQRKGSFWTSKKLWIPAAFLAAGYGGFLLGQEKVTVKSGGCTFCDAK